MHQTLLNPGLLKVKLEDCQKENEALKELVASQKKVIGMLERKKG